MTASKMIKPPLPFIPRGVGGSNMNDLRYYCNRIILCNKPWAVVVYEGDNDIARGISPEKITETFCAFAGTVHNEFTEYRIYLLKIACT
ncbi:MAG: hypothetical protein GXO83_10810 [Chlorobi bacterium]|nr:hypothetical protein [Chlorobiota bacterium]